jgi:hypothetical protein
MSACRTEAEHTKGWDYATQGHAVTVSRTATGCPSNPCTVPITVQLLGKTDDVGTNKPPTKDRLVALVTNDGQYSEAMYKMKPSSEAIYFVRLKGGNGSSQSEWRLVEFGLEEGKVDHNFAKGKIIECDTHKPNESAVGFKNCGRIKPSSAAKSMSWFASATIILSRLVGGNADAQARPYDDALWISCTSGCCSLMY